MNQPARRLDAAPLTPTRPRAATPLRLRVSLIGALLIALAGCAGAADSMSRDGASEDSDSAARSRSSADGLLSADAQPSVDAQPSIVDPPTNTAPSAVDAATICQSAREGQPCSGDVGFCVIDWGEPCGWSSALWCRDGAWMIEEEQNLCEDSP